MSESSTGRNLVVCSDGTGNEGGTEAESNIFKLYRLLSDEDSEHAYYDQGLGTEKLPLLGKAFGVGISKNIQDCYRYLVREYHPGDSIYLFGFSRGAFTARSLGGLITRCGLFRRKVRDIGSFCAAYEIGEPLVHESVELRRSAPLCGYDPGNLPGAYRVVGNRAPADLM